MSGDVIMKQDGYIIAETNHKIYGYCSSTLTIKVLSLIVDMRVRLRNLIVGKVTRNSIRSAFAKGITATQIIDFLEKNAHPETQKLDFPVPETLIHQIQLWEREENAVEPADGVLYERFTSGEEYNLLKNVASEAQILLWFNDELYLLFITLEGVQGFDEHIRHYTNS